MRVPVSWLREHVALPDDLSVDDLADRLTMLDLKLEEVDRVGGDVTGPLVVGRVLTAEPEEHSNGKTVNWCRVDVGPEHNDENGARGIVCGAHNFGPGDLVVVSLPGTVLPGGFAIAARKTYGHVSDGMICSTRELDLGDDHDGILVLAPGSAEPGDDVPTLLGLREDVLDLEVNPDRAYALSIRGVARDAALGYGVPFTDPAELPVPDATGEAWPVAVEAPDACPVFVARTVTGLDASRPTPSWMSRRLQLAGMRPISLAVDVTNYVMLELGQPIHGYDRDHLQGGIVVRRATEGEKLTTLDGQVRDVSADDLLICDDSGPIGLAGVMGGEHTELSGTTTSVVVEAAHFAPSGIARTARLHRLPSEASKRFERGVDPALPRFAAQRVVDLLVEHGGATAEPGETVVGSAPSMPTIELNPVLPAAVTGIAVKGEDAADALRANGCAVEGSGTDGLLSVVPPTWRPDLTDPYDLVEEVLRVVGYDRVPSVLPVAPSGRGLTRRQRLRRLAGRGLAGAGLTEAMVFPFLGTADLDLLGLPADDSRRDLVLLENPLSAQEPGLVSTLLPGLLHAAARNVSRGQEQVALYETSPVFLGAQDAVAPVYGVDQRPTPEQVAALDAALPAQPLHLGVVLAGDREPAGWWGPARPVSWADPIDVVREVARLAGVEVQARPASLAPWHPGRCAELVVDGAVVGHAGELHPRVCRAFDLPARSVAAEVDLDAILDAAPGGVRPEPYSVFPVAKEDVALVVDASVAAVDVAAALTAGGGDLLESVRLFDVYTGHPVPEGQKSLAFALRLRAPDRTLSDEEITATREAAVAEAVRTTGAVQRT
ncbi:phenylalanine--tRNA ligase subunit beta [Solicola sp. PLA-1-18]|uniref:phenylalanine--tRNA ligase subunit beta n=1 Tax=Solicola sp. PLA-1-18 TaxID=3380532 RepID=UPI003B78BD94